MRTIKHPTLGEVEVIVEVMNSGKHFFLIKRRVKKWKSKAYSWQISEKYELPARPWEKATEYHYCMWGNTNDPNEMGTTKILTKGGSKPRSTTVNKYFFEMVKTSEKLTFKK